MKMDRQLLADYFENGSETAFREVVARYINLVYATAVRLVDGDTHLAEDVTQTVFADLARLAGTLSADVMLGGWLHRRACHVAATLMRGIRRRQNRERQAADMISPQTHSEAEKMVPLLDDAIDRLKAADRAAIVLRFFENRDLRSIGEALGSNEDAVQKRISRALDKLRTMLSRRGVQASTSALIVLLTAQGAAAAPAGLASVVSGAALAGAASSAGLTLTILKYMAVSKIKMVIGAVLVACVGTSLVIEQQAHSRLRQRNQALRQEVDKLTQQANESHAMQVSESGKLAPGDERGKIGDKIAELRQQTGQLGALQAENRRLMAGAGESDTPEEAEFKEQTMMQAEHIKQWGLSFRMYAMNHDSQLPATFDQAASMRKNQDLSDFDTNRFEITHKGSLASLTNGGMILFRETQAKRSPKGEWVKIYGLADGSVQTITKKAEGDFEAYEKQFIPAAH
jgi:RNA polymerase sigma factor (sigma-70 family)